MKYTEHEACCKVHHHECKHAKGIYKGYEVVIRLGRGCIDIVVKAPVDISNDIRNEVVNSQARIFELIGKEQ